jgi:hypothetical protein
MPIPSNLLFSPQGTLKHQPVREAALTPLRVLL